MKVILKDEVKGLGHRGDVVTVSAGYARNFLLPKDLALLATAGNTKLLDQEKRRYDARMAKEQQQAETIAKSMEGLSIVVKKKAGEHEALFGQVTAAELAEALKAKGVTIDKRRIEIQEPIKRLGKHTIHVKLHRDVTVELGIEVQPGGN
ncbi:MAG: 50S ribosomal protein L9 [Acidobacteria bacterium]|nr:50S ribosomal protein L9 [Acidobacteriota bacterium]MCG3194247.1 50S ribosomal protein L9 [Thermoanaerobaculia bacterium]MCK6684308.1 50S ribosomal protein L9 [Thermoanaerobaculia bacterium]